jgi:toxin ParE1/3/4
VNYSFLPSAQAEYLDAVRFFDERRAGLGAALINEFERIVALAVSWPDAWKLVHPSGIRQIGLTRFPYSVFYRVLPGGQPQVTAFAHHRRRPGYWIERIGP